MQDTTLTFLVANMKEMETELHAQSIALDALGRGIVGIQSVLRMARAPTAMLAYVEKYELLGQRLGEPSHSRVAKDVAECIELTHASDFLH